MRLLSLLLRLVLADEGDALRNVRDGFGPLVFVFDRNVAIEPLTREFIQNGRDIGDAGAIRKVMSAFFSKLVQVLQVAADDSPFENFQAIHGFETGTNPMARIGAGTDAFVAVFHHFQDVIGIPHAVAGLILALGMIMESDHDVVFFYHFFDGVDGVRAFGGHGAEAKFLGKLKNFARFIFALRDPNHAVVHGFDVMLFQLGLDFGDRFVGRVVIPAHLWLVLAQFLAGVKLDDLGAGLSGFLNGFENCIVIERVSLATNKELAALVFIGDFDFSAEAGCGGQNQKGRDGLRDFVHNVC